MATTALIDRLQAAGHVVRERDPQDRRRVTVRMEDPALELALRFFRPLGELMAREVADVPADELHRTAEIVRRLTGAVTRARRDAAGEPGT